MPRGIYDRGKRAKLAPPTLSLLPEVTTALTAALSAHLPDGLLPYVSESGEVRIFRLVRTPIPPRWVARLLSPEETDAALGRRPPALQAKPGKKRGPKPGRKPGRKKRAKAAQAEEKE